MPAAAFTAALAPRLMMRPAPRASRCGRAALDAATAVLALTAYSRSQFARSPSCRVCQRKVPAALTRTSRPPKCEATRPSAAAAASKDERSTFPIFRAPGSSPWSDGAADARSTSATFAPCAVAASATFAPRFPNAPVIAMTLPVRSMIFSWTVALRKLDDFGLRVADFGENLSIVFAQARWRQAKLGRCPGKVHRDRGRGHRAFAGMLVALEESGFVQIRVGEQSLQGVHGAVGNVDIVENPVPLGGAPELELLGNNSVQLVVVPHALLRPGKARVLGQLRAAQGRKQA